MLRLAFEVDINSNYKLIINKTHVLIDITIKQNISDCTNPSYNILILKTYQHLFNKYNSKWNI